MRRLVAVTGLLLAVGLGLGLAGCATTQGPAQGNFLDNAAAPLQQSLAEAAVQPLLTLFPRGATRFALQQATPDAFGQALVAALRARGYAVQEFTSAASAPSPPAAHSSAAPPTPPTPLGYLLDQGAGPESYRLTLRVGSQTLSRVYQIPTGARPGQLQPAGAWLRKE